jgi:solute carrier family 25 (adenine nucleotide translocator) protein 4/5/6/31
MIKKYSVLSYLVLVQKFLINYTGIIIIKKMSNFASTSSSIHLSDFNDHIFKGLAAGVLSASVTKTSVAPIDRIKLILQLQNRTLSIYGQTQPYKGIVDCFKRLCAEQGWRSLWRGNSASLVRIVPSNVLNIAFRDYFRVMFLSNVNRRKQRLRFYAGFVQLHIMSRSITF